LLLGWVLGDGYWVLVCADDGCRQVGWVLGTEVIHPAWVGRLWPQSFLRAPAARESDFPKSDISLFNPSGFPTPEGFEGGFCS
jgi:hypothetical protein